MAQLDGMHRHSQTPKSSKSNSPTFEQLLQGEYSAFASSTSPTFRRYHDQEEDIGNHNRKSVITKVKEKAKKLKQTLSGKKKPGNDHDGSTTPTWSVSFDDDEEEDDDPEYLGAPMYESELAPESYKETARQHPRANPVLSEKHRMPTGLKHNAEGETKNPDSPNKSITETVSEKLAPAYAAVSDATHSIASKFTGLSTRGDAEDTAANTSSMHIEFGAGNSNRTSGTCSETRNQGVYSPRTWDKGVSVKEYFMNKLEPGEDERALSQVITDAISPKKNGDGMGVVEKVKEAVTSFLRHEESSNSSIQATNTSSHSHYASAKVNRSQHEAIFSANKNPSLQVPISSNANRSPVLPVSTYAHEVIEEENHGRILQAN